jgi:putative membrane protein
VQRDTYLALADIVNSARSAFLAFCDRPVYSYYLDQSNLFHISPHSDQVVGAVIVWVIGSLVFLIPIMAVTIHLLKQETAISRVSRLPTTHSQA